MATLLELHSLLFSDGDLWKKVEVACIKAAVDILNEDDATPNHADRSKWAEKVLGSRAGSQRAVSDIRWSVVSNATVQANGHAAADADVQFVVNGAIDMMLKVQKARDDAAAAELSARA